MEKITEFLMAYLLKIKDLLSSLTPFKELFVLLGFIFIVWAIVALFIKKVIRKSNDTDYFEDSDELIE